MSDEKSGKGDRPRPVNNVPMTEVIYEYLEKSARPVMEKVAKYVMA